jgi:hypothetical protein
MTFSAIGGATYEVRGVLQVSVGNTSSNEFFLGFNPSTGSLTTVAVSLFAFTPVAGNTGVQATNFMTAGGTGGEIGTGTIAKNTTVDIIISGIITLSATCTLNTIWHWTNSNGVGGVSDQLKANSYLSFTRVK